MNKFQITMEYAKIINIKERVETIPAKIENMPKMSFMTPVEEILVELSTFLDNFEVDGFSSKIDCGKDILNEVKEYYMKSTSKKNDFTEKKRIDLVLQSERLVNYIDAFDDAFKTAFKYKL